MKILHTFVPADLILEHVETGQQTLEIVLPSSTEGKITKCWAISEVDFFFYLLFTV